MNIVFITIFLVFNEFVYLMVKKTYFLFNQLQVIKNDYVLETLIKMKNDIADVKNILIFNHSNYACKLSQLLLINNYNVTIVANLSYQVNVEKGMVETTINLAKEKKLKFEIINYDPEKKKFMIVVLSMHNFI